MNPEEPAKTSQNPTPSTNPALAEFMASAPTPRVEPPEPKRTTWTIIGGVAGALFSWIIFPISIVLILHFFVFQAYHVVGSSMSPTLSESDYLIVSKVGKTGAGLGQVFGHDGRYIPARGQIIVFLYPKNPSS